MSYELSFLQHEYGNTRRKKCCSLGVEKHTHNESKVFNEWAYCKVLFVFYRRDDYQKCCAIILAVDLFF